MDTREFSVYILILRNGKFYVDYTYKDIYAEYKLHIMGENELTKAYLPCFLMYVQKFDNESEAVKRVKSIKRMNVHRRFQLIKSGLNQYVKGAGTADKLQIILHKEHGVNGIRYYKNTDDMEIDYTVCFNPNCPKHCNNKLFITNKSSVETSSHGTQVKSPSGNLGILRSYMQVAVQDYKDFPIQIE